MEQRPEQPPEGRLIADAAERLDLSIREAARRAGISYGRWRQIVTGYQNVSPGSFATVHAPARTLAKMAAVVGITPEQMETEGQRPDAAEAMRQQVPSRITPPEPRPVRDYDDEPGLLPWLETVQADEDAAREKYGPAPTPEQIFSEPWEAELWRSVNLPLPLKRRSIAQIRQRTAEADAEHGRRAVLMRT